MWLVRASDDMSIYTGTWSSRVCNRVFGFISGDFSRLPAFKGSCRKRELGEREGTRSLSPTLTTCAIVDWKHEVRDAPANHKNLVVENCLCNIGPE